MFRISKWTSLLVLALVLAAIPCAMYRADGRTMRVAEPFRARFCDKWLWGLGMGEGWDVCALGMRTLSSCGGGAPPSIAAPTTRAATSGDGGSTELFELRIYTAAPGKMEALHRRFRDHTLKFFDKHGIRSVAYWSAVDDKHQGRLYYIVAYPDTKSREMRLVNGIAKDPEFLKVVAESEKDGKLTTEIESVLLAPTDYSPKLTAAQAAVQENAMLSKLPAPVLTYLAAEKAKNPEMLSFCFADDALVHDEGKDHRGLDAIKDWKRKAEAKYQYVLEPLDASVGEKTVKLRARLTGNFPGSPVELNFTFTLAGEKIASLDIR
jgi:hypothetical protein